MRRCVRSVLWLTTSIVFGAAGCSPEVATPPLLTIKSPNDEARKPSDALLSTAPNEAIGSQETETDRPTSAADVTADDAVRAVLQRLRQSQPDAIWDALPASYQNDLNDLLHLSARRLNPEAWRWFLQIAGKGAAVIRKHTQSTPSDPSSTEEDENTRRAIDTLADLLERISKSDEGFLLRMKTADVGELLGTDVKSLIPLVASLLEPFNFGHVEIFREITQASVSIKDAASDTVVLELGTPDTIGTRIEFVRVEGKWIPRWLADQWSGAISSARSAVLEALPSENANENFGRTFQALAAIDFYLDAAKNPEDMEDPDNFVGSILSPARALITLGYLIGGPPTLESDFHAKTKQTLEDRSKVALVYCYAPKEIKWGHETVDFDLAKHVAYQLNGKKIKVVDPDRVYAWLDKHDDWRKTSEIGAAFKVDYVVHIDVKDYSLTEPNVNNLYRGTADCIVNVVKMDEDKRGGTVIYSNPIKSAFPKNGPVDQSAMPYAEFKKRYLSALSFEIGKLFFSTAMGDEISEGILQE